MADQFIAYDPTATSGLRLAPEVRAEIVAVAPSTVLNSSISTAKLADDSVTAAKIATGAVTSSELATSAVLAANISTAAVTTTKIADASITPAKTTTGVVTSVDSSDVAAVTVIKYVTAAQYAAIATPNPNTLYFVS